MLEAVLTFYLIGALATFFFLFERFADDPVVDFFVIILTSLLWPVFLMYQVLAYLQNLHNRLS